MTVIRVYGSPAPQGSKRAFIRNGRPVVVEQQHGRIRSWRQAIIDELAGTLPLEGPVTLDVTFLLPRPKAHYGTGRNAAQLRESAPAYPAGMPDLDKLLRSTMDALTAAGAWKDDAQVVKISAGKVYSDGQPGAIITYDALRVPS